MTEAAQRKVVAEAVVASKSLASRRLRLNPGEAPFNNPPARMHREAELIRRLAHDLDGDAGYTKAC